MKFYIYAANTSQKLEAVVQGRLLKDFFLQQFWYSLPLI